MQELVIDRVERKSPKKPDGNPFFVIYGQGGEEMTSFDTALEALGRGSRINVEPKVSGKHINIAKWELLEAVEGNGKPGSHGADKAGNFKRDTEGIRFEYELKAKLQARERASIEAQTAYNGAIALINGGNVNPSDEEDKEVYALIQAALKWGAKALTSQVSPAAEPPPKTKETTSEEDWDAIKRDGDKKPAAAAKAPDFKDGYDLVNHALKMGWRMHEIREKLKIEDPSGIKDVAKAYAELFPPESPP